MEEKSLWQEFKELITFSFLFFILIYKYSNWKEKKVLEANEVYYQKEF